MLRTLEGVGFTDSHLYMTINTERCTAWQSLALQGLSGRCGSFATGFEVLAIPQVVHVCPKKNLCNPNDTRIRVSNTLLAAPKPLDPLSERLAPDLSPPSLVSAWPGMHVRAQAVLRGYCWVQMPDLLACTRHVEPADMTNGCI